MSQLPQPCIDDLQTPSIETASTLIASWYSSPDVLQIENQKLLSSHWQYACASSEITEKGSYIPLEVAATPILLVRDQENKLHGYVNICRHRGGPLATKSGKGRMLRCEYHGWSYKMSGELIGTPKFEGVKDFDPKCYGLTKIQVTDWHGLLFVNLDMNAPPIQTSFSGVLDRKDNPCEIADLKFFRRDLYQAKCNWKVYVDNYLEGYHVGMVHPELASVLDTSNYKTDLGKEWSLQHSPLQDKPNPYSQGSGSAHYYFIFPNIMLNILPGRLQVNSVIPRGPNACETIFDYFYSDDTHDLLAKRADDDAKFSDIVQQQDISIAESVQRAFDSGKYLQGRYSVQEERSLHHFHEWYRKQMASLSGYRG